MGLWHRRQRAIVPLGCAALASIDIGDGTSGERIGVGQRDPRLGGSVAISGTDVAGGQVQSIVPQPVRQASRCQARLIARRMCSQQRRSAHRTSSSRGVPMHRPVSDASFRQSDRVHSIRATAHDSAAWPPSAVAIASRNWLRVTYERLEARAFRFTGRNRADSTRCSGVAARDVAYCGRWPACSASPLPVHIGRFDGALYFSLGPG